MKVIQGGFPQKIDKTKLSTKILQFAAFGAFALFAVVNERSGAELGRMACSELDVKIGHVLYHNLNSFKQVGFERVCYEYTNGMNMRQFEYDFYLELLKKNGWL